MACDCSDGGDSATAAAAAAAVVAVGVRHGVWFKLPNKIYV